MTLTDVERMELARRINSRNGRADEARRARISRTAPAQQAFLVR